MKKLIATLMLGAFATTCTMSAMAAPAHQIDQKPMPKFAQDKHQPSGKKLTKDAPKAKFSQDQHKKPAPHLKQDFKKPMPKVQHNDKAKFGKDARKVPPKPNQDHKPVKPNERR